MVIIIVSTENVEADAFFCFTNLMSEIRDNFIKTLDDSACGIGMWFTLIKPMNLCSFLADLYVHVPVP